MQVEPQNEHRWLQRMVGEWTMEGECSMGPGQPTMKSTGTDSVRAVGDVWVQCEGNGEMPGGGDCTTFMTFMTLGYDPVKKRFVGTFVGSMMTHLWVYDGELDAAGNVLTLFAEGPSFTDPAKMEKYKDVFELKSNDHRVLSSHLLGEGGQWTQFMTAHYRRKN